MPTIPTPQEVRRVAAAVLRAAQVLDDPSPPVAPADLALLAGLRPGVEPGTALDALVRAGALVVEGEAGPPADPGGADTVGLWAVAADPQPALAAGWGAARALARALRSDARWEVGTPVPVRAAEIGLERDAAERAVALLAGFGCVRALPHPADGRLPRVRAGAAPLTVLAGPSAACGEGIVAMALDVAVAAGGLVDLTGVAERTGRGARELRDALRAAHLLGVVRLDPQSWRSGGHAVRVRPAADILERAARIRPGDVHPAAPPASDALEGLNTAQREAVTHPSARLAVVAGPGTGKTRTLTRRIAHRVVAGAVRAEGVLAVTFTTDAAQEMQQRLAALGVRGARVGTLNAVGHRIVRDHFRAAGFAAPPQVAPTPQGIGLVRDLLAADREGADLDALQVHTLIARAKAELWDPDRLAGAGDPPFRCPERRGAVARVWRAYDATLREHGVLDFADQIRLAVRVLDDASRAVGVRAVIDEVYVDEFQDLSPLQIAFVERLAEGRGLTVVGDPRQSVYEWNGASPEALGRFARRPAVAAVELDVNYRSTEPILRAANRLMAAEGLRPVRPPAPAPGPPVGLRRTRGEDAAVAATARLVEGHLAGGSAPGDVAVLVRLNDELRTMRRGLAAAGLPVQASDLVGLHQTAAHRAARRQLTPERVRAAGGLAPAMDALRAVDDPVAALASAGEDPADAAADWARLTAALADADRAGEDDPARALEAIARDEREEGRADRAGGVVLTTMHRAKGREWDAVVVACLDVRTWDGRQPEERRIAYVALTRARRRLDVVLVGGDRRLLQEAGITPASSPRRPRPAGTRARR